MFRMGLRMKLRIDSIHGSAVMIYNSCGIGDMQRQAVGDIQGFALIDILPPHIENISSHMAARSIWSDAYFVFIS